ncbi:hypothetical protein NBRC116594_14630 [Shimia sp. NS0008-38b]|uniref:hypothetical protein n=1 Tax=Shimia sp. NS0008-38b TaxID=3127653 RepID=UPI003105AF24
MKAKSYDLDGLQAVFSSVNALTEEVVGFGFQRLVFGAGWYANRDRVAQAIQEPEQVIEIGETERVFEVMDVHAMIGLFERDDSVAACEVMFATLKDLRQEWPFRPAELRHRVARFPRNDV